MFESLNFPSINGIGVELEGAWNTTPTHPFGEWHGDVSVKTFKGFTYTGEYVSKPLLLSDRKWKTKLEDFLKSCWPLETNKSMGMHTHVSFHKESSYACLAEKDFEAYFMKWFNPSSLGQSIELPSWYDDRYKGDLCSHTQPTFQPYQQILQKYKSPVRYCHLNYCWKIRNTIECRLFPMCEEYQDGMGLIYNLLCCIQTYLFNNRAQFMERDNYVVDIEFEEEEIVPTKEVDNEMVTMTPQLKEFLTQSSHTH
jgi:hypothetical protein